MIHGEFIAYYFDETALIPDQAWEALSAMAISIPIAPYFRATRSRREIKADIQKLRLRGDNNNCLCGHHEASHADIYDHQFVNAYQHELESLQDELFMAPEDEAERIHNITRVMCGGHSRD